MPNKALPIPLCALLFLAQLLPPGTAYCEPASAGASVKEESPTSLEQARELFSGYNKKNNKIDVTIALTEEILKREPDNVPALIFLSRAWLTYGYVKAHTKKDLIRAFENGVSAAKKAKELEPDNPDAHFFYVANLASLGDTKGLFNSLFMLPEVRRELETILDLDPNHAKGLAMTGALYMYLPTILGGDLHISEVYLKRSLSVNPHLSSAQLYLALDLKKQKKYEEALEVLRDLLNDKEPSFYPDWVENRRYAYIMMRGIREKMAQETAKKEDN
jgi:tetratricopeptide (TPR) repeat protein